MTSYRIHTPENAPIGSRDILAEIEGMAGFVPNVFGLIANSPNALAALHAMNGFFKGSSFTPQEQEIIALATSVENRCSYCVAGHTTFAHALCVDPSVIEDVREARETTDNKAESLRLFVTRVVREKGAVSKQEVASFVAQGYTESQIFELLIGVATKMVTNFASKLANIPIDAAFAENAWAPEVGGETRVGGFRDDQKQPIAATGN
jgi:uncharacterized peroxidase-related enzyme